MITKCFAAIVFWQMEDTELPHFLGKFNFNCSINKVIVNFLNLGLFGCFSFFWAFLEKCFETNDAKNNTLYDNVSKKRIPIMIQSILDGRHFESEYFYEIYHYK